MNLNFKKLEKAVDKFKKTAKHLAEKGFLIFFLFFFIFLLTGFIIFYYYFYSVEVFLNQNLDHRLLSIDKAVQSRVLKEWQERNQKFEMANFKEYSDPFYRLD